MGYAERLISRDMSVCSLVCASPAVSLNLLGTLRDDSRRTTVREIDVSAIMDTLELVKGGRKRIEVDVELATESAPVARSLVGCNIVFTHDISGKSEGLTGVLLSSEERSGGVDGAQTETFSIVCTVEPTG